MFGGRDRDRTDGLIVANDALSQLSYSPTSWVQDYFTSTVQYVVTNACAAGKHTYSLTTAKLLLETEL